MLVDEKPQCGTDTLWGEAARLHGLQHWRSTVWDWMGLEIHMHDGWTCQIYILMSKTQVSVNQGGCNILYYSFYFVLRIKSSGFHNWSITLFDYQCLSKSLRLVLNWPSFSPELPSHWDYDLFIMSDQCIASLVNATRMYVKFIKNKLANYVK